MPNLFQGASQLDGLPQTTRSGIYYEIDSLAYREQWVPRANQTTVVARVPTDQSWDFVTDMVGRSYAQNGAIRRDVPEKNPFDQKQFCTRVEQIDQGGDPDFDWDNYRQGDNTATNDGPRYDPESGWPLTLWVRYKLTFEALPYPILTDAEADAVTADATELSRYVYRKRVTTTKEQQFPGGSFYLINGGSPLLSLGQIGFKLRGAADVTYTWFRVPVANIPTSAIGTAIGKVNSAAFDTISPGGYNFSAGELLLTGYDDTDRYYDANEDWVCDLVYRFKWLKGGWNYYLSATTALVEVSDDGTNTGNRPYSSVSFTNLFTLA